MQNLSDRALKERVIGAVVLVLFAVLVVPVFLDGPSDESEIISESVTLPGQNSQQRQQQTIVLQRDRSQPVPSTRPPEPAPQQSSPAPQPKSPVAEQKVEEDKPEAAPVAASPAPEAAQPAAENTSSTGMWAVQLGSFADKENAERLAADLRNQGFAAFLSQLQTDSGALQRVRVGPQKDRDSAEAIAAQLAKGGHNGQVVPHP